MRPAIYKKKKIKLLHMYTGKCTRMFVTAWFIVAQNWKSPKSHYRRVNNNTQFNFKNSDKEAQFIHKHMDES